MTSIKQEDLIQSIADAFQFISYYHPVDFVKALGEAYERHRQPDGLLAASYEVCLGRLVRR